MKLVELSHPLHPGMYQVGRYPELDVDVKTLRTVREHGAHVERTSFGNHLGTHVDVPKHVVEGGESIDQFPLDAFYGTAVVLDIPKGPDAAVTVGDLEAANPTIEKDDIVLLHTGWGHQFANAEYYAEHHAYLSTDAAEWLVRKHVKMVGIDASSMDLPHSLRKQGFKYTSLLMLLKNGVPVIHSLTNLELVSGRRVMVYALPLNIRGASGAPARVVAQVN